MFKNKRKQNSNSDNDLKLDSYVKIIDKKKVDEIKKLHSEGNNKEDIVYELYDKQLLTPKRLNFIIKNWSNYLSISSSLIKRIIKEDNFKLFEIIFENFKFFDSDFILSILLNYYKNKISISTSELNQQISKYKYSNRKKRCIPLVMTIYIMHVKDQI